MDEDKHSEEFTLPPSISTIIEGMHVPADPGNKTDFETPSWFSYKKYKLGQKFAMKNFTSLNIIEMMSLMMVFSFKDGLEPLIFTNRSSSPFTAFQRYLSTLFRIRSWYSEDIWDRKSLAGRNITSVRIMHRNVRDRMKNDDPEEISKRIHIENPTCPMLKFIHTDAKSTISEPKPGQRPYYSQDKLVYVNQLHMSGTQFSFVGLTVLYGSKFGISGTDKELDAFVHLWACIGYLLGIEDKFNFCLGGLETCRERCRDLIEVCVKPNLQDVAPEWEHMCRSLVEGGRQSGPMPVLGSFEAMFCYLCWVMEIPLKYTYQRFSFFNRLCYNAYWIMFCFLLYIPGFRSCINWYFDLCTTRALKFSPEYLEQLRQTSETYLKSHSKLHQM